MNLRLFALFALSLALLVSVVSAALTLPSQITVSGAHNTDIAIPFNLTSDTNYTNINWSISSTTTILTLKTPPINSISAQQTIPTSAVLSIPKHASGAHQIMLIAKDGTQNIGSLTININIAPSSALSQQITQQLSFTQNGSVNVTNTGNTPLPSVALSGNIPLTFSKNNFNLNPGGTETVTVQATDFSALKFGDMVRITAQSGSAQDTKSFTFSKSFCRNGEKGNLSIIDVDITNEGRGDEEEWEALDRITIKVEVENNGDNEIEDIDVELGLFDSTGKNMVDDLDFFNQDEERIDLGDLDDNDEKTVTFDFKVPADIDKGGYKLAVKAFSTKSGESNVCTDTSDKFDDAFFQSIRVEREEEEGRFIVFDNIDTQPSEATCGDTVSLTFDVVNIGEDDEDRVKVNLGSRELDINLFQEIRDLEQDEKKRVSFTFTVPQGLEDKGYILLLDAEYDYDNGVYDQSSEESTSVNLKIFGCAQEQEPIARLASITGAALQSEPMPGKELKVRATIKNIGATENSFVVSAADYESWAELTDVSDSTLLLGAGESEDVIFTLLVDRETTGEQAFTIEARSGSSVEQQEVAVILASRRPSIDSLFTQGNTLIWIIGIVNIILIILIIVVAMRIARK